MQRAPYLSYRPEKKERDACLFAVFFPFAAAVLFCAICGYPVIFALSFGYVLFFLYDVMRGAAPKSLLSRSRKGICRVKNVFFNYALVGMLTALWRACGTIPLLIDLSIEALRPQLFVLLSFLLCAGFSVLTGTAFGSVSTVGLLCMTIGSSLGLHPAVLGGAILSGVRFGDRCSPVSTSALLISEVTNTDIYANIKNMLRTALLPFLLACAVYLMLGQTMSVSADSEVIHRMLSSHFSLSPLCALPVIGVVVMALFHVPARPLFLCSIGLSACIAVLCEKLSPLDLLPILVFGFHPADAQLSHTLSGGGISSVLSTLLIVLVSSTYIELFRAGDLLSSVERQLERIAKTFGAFAAVLLVSILIALISCNQTLTIMLTASLCAKIMPNPSRMAASLADSASIIPALVPWSVACALPLSTIGAPVSAVPFAVYIYLLPLCHFFTQRFIRETPNAAKREKD